MADVKTIGVSTKQTGVVTMFFRHVVIWGFLVGAEAGSHLWFGGSWVIDMMILTALVLFVINMATKKSGMAVEMTPAEIRLWVAAGMPNDIKEWRTNRKLASVA